MPQLVLAIIVIRVRQARKVVREPRRRTRNGIVLRRRRDDLRRRVVSLERRRIERGRTQQMDGPAHGVVGRPADVRLLRPGELEVCEALLRGGAFAGRVERVDGGEEGVGRVAAEVGAGTAAFVQAGAVLAGFGGGVGREGGVGLVGAAGEDVEGGVDGDFKVAALCGVDLIRFGEAQDDLQMISGTLNVEAPGLP